MKPAEDRERAWLYDCPSRLGGWLHSRVRQVLAAMQPVLAERIPAESGLRLLSVHPHDPTAHTQGLLSIDGALYESTGLFGQSTLRRVELETGKVLNVRRLPGRLFAEGIACSGDHIAQLTWRSGIGLVYDRASLEPISEFPLAGEGWGLAFDGQRLIMSDGTAVLRFLDPTSFREIGRLEVRDQGRGVPGLNDLTVIGDEVVANLHAQDRLARISPDGRVAGWIDVSAFRRLPGHRGRDQLTNGVAWDPTRERLLITGKRWPRLFEIGIAQGR